MRLHLSIPFPHHQYLANLTQKEREVTTQKEREVTTQKQKQKIGRQPPPQKKDRDVTTQKEREVTHLTHEIHNSLVTLLIRIAIPRFIEYD